MILISYDGSADAKAAIDRAAKLMPDEKAIVMTVWETFVGPFFENSDQIDETSRATALATATEGADRANEAGLSAESRVSAGDGGIANTVLVGASDVDADLIVIGTRGRGGVKSFLLGSVSHGVVGHAGCAVMVVPSEEVAQRRLAV